MTGPLNSGSLADLGLQAGQPVRFRRQPGDHWSYARVVSRERDGSVGLVDGNGASRAIAVDRIEVRVARRRASAAWEALAEQVSDGTQMSLGF